MDRAKVKEQIGLQIAELLQARAQVDDAARAKLDAEVARLRDVQARLMVDEADDLAARLEEATDALEKIRTEHALDAVSNLARAIEGLGSAELALRHDQPASASGATTLRDAAPVVAAAVTGAALAAVAAAKVIKTLSSKSFESLNNEYTSFFDQCRTRPERQQDVDRLASRIRANRARYEAVGGPLGIPWRFIGVVHAMEGSLNFATHLHNGDPLTARTRQVPKGRPATGSPPFTWEESATDALKLDGLDRNTDWSSARMLFLLERFNGFGYRPKGIPSPYLWSFSNLYEKGKFTADGKFDSQAVSKQCGAALLLKALA